MSQAEKQIATTEQDQVASMISVIERAALNPEVDIDKMERLLQMQERIMEKQAEIEFNSSLVTVQQNLPHIPRDASNTQTNSRYSKLETINQRLIPVYTSAGFSLSFGTDDAPHEGFIRIVCDVSHMAGHTRRYHYDLPLDDAGIRGTKNKTGIHASGSTISYGRRYLTNMIFNLVLGGEDNDGNNAVVYISDEQINELHALASENGILDKTMNWLAKKGINSLEEIPANVYPNILATVKGQIK